MSFVCDHHRCPHRAKGFPYCVGNIEFAHVIPLGDTCADIGKCLRCCDGCMGEAIRLKNEIEKQFKLAFGVGQ